MIKYREDDSYKDLSDGEILDIVFDKFGLSYNPKDVIDDVTKNLMSKIDMSNRYEKALANMLFEQAVTMNKADLQDVLFFEEETTNNWSIEECRIQFVKDQLDFINGGNLDDEINETWRLINVEIS